MIIVLFGLVWVICVSLLLAIFFMVKRVQKLERQVAVSIDLHRQTADMFDSLLQIVKNK